MVTTPQKSREFEFYWFRFCYCWQVKIGTEIFVVVVVVVFVVFVVVVSSVIVNIMNAILIIITIVDKELARSLHIKFFKCRSKKNFALLPYFLFVPYEHYNSLPREVCLSIDNNS